MFKALKCRLNGHIFVDSRSQPGVEVCVRCRRRQTFEGLKAPPVTQRHDRRATDWSGLPGDPTRS